jgi:hypothetical protein
VSRHWFSPRDAPLPSFGSRRARFPAVSGTMKALRLPIRASAVAYWFRSRRPRDPPSSCSLARSRKSGGLFRARVLMVPATPISGSRAWTRMGSLRSSGDPSRAFAPFHDPGRTDVPSPWRSRRCCPRFAHSEGFGRWLISGLTPAASAPAVLRFVFRVAAHTQGSLPAGRLGLCREGVEPSGPLREVSARVDDHPPLLLS